MCLSLRPPGLLLTLVLLASCPCPAPAQTQRCRHGGIEIGAKGVKATVIEVTIDKDGHASGVGGPKLNKTVNTTLVTLKDGKFRSDAIQETAEAVQKFYKLMQQDFRVPAHNIYVVGSSGLPDVPNRQELIDAVERATRDDTGKGKVLMFIDQRDEVRLSILGLVQAEYVDNSVFVDIGSGSTKCGYIEPETRTSAYRLSAVRTRIDGTVAFTRRIKATKANGGDFIRNAGDLRVKHVTEPLQEELSRRPGLVNRNRVFFSGGIVWAMVTLTKPETCNDPLVSLTVADFDRFYAMATKNPGVFPEPDLSKITDQGVRARASKDIRRVKDVFTPENLVAGAEILRGIVKAFRLDRGRKLLYFSREGYIAWIYAYVKESVTPRP
jgi:Ppx/GppA phosphatase family